jgi:hypothetical protein
MGFSEVIPVSETNIEVPWHVSATVVHTYVLRLLEATIRNDGTNMERPHLLLCRISIIANYFIYTSVIRSVV